MGSRRRVRPDRRRYPRGLRGAAEAQEPSEEIGAVLLKHRQDGFWGEGNLCVHGETHSVPILTDSSGETASTPKIVSDVARTSTCRCERDDEPAHAASASVQLRMRGLGLPDTVVAARRRCCDITGGPSCGSTDKTMRPPMAASSRELAFRLLYIRRPGAGIRRLFTPGRKVGGLVEKARGDIRIRGGHCKFQQGCGLFR